MKPRGDVTRSPKHCSGGSKGGAPPWIQILSISCSFWENLAKSYAGAPPGELAPPPRGNPGSATEQGIIGPTKGTYVLQKFRKRKKDFTVAIIGSWRQTVE